MKQEQPTRWGDEASEWKHLMMVIIAVAVLIGLGWITWFKFGWFH